VEVKAVSTPVAPYAFAASDGLRHSRFLVRVDSRLEFRIACFIGCSLRLFASVLPFKLTRAHFAVVSANAYNFMQHVQLLPSLRKVCNVS